jgi:hypothetical protein
VVGFIDGGSADGSARFVTAFRKGLNETGFGVLPEKFSRARNRLTYRFGNPPPGGVKARAASPP